jgi:hypothetical protein
MGEGRGGETKERLEREEGIGRQEEWGEKNPKCEIMADEKDKKCNGVFKKCLAKTKKSGIFSKRA